MLPIALKLIRAVCSASELFVSTKVIIERKGFAMFLNCYDGYDCCLFTVRIKDGIEAESLGNFIARLNDMISFWMVSDAPEGAVVRY
jgi:hypothetical protein